MVPEKDIETEDDIFDDFEGKNKMDDAELLEDKCGHLKKLTNACSYYDFFLLYQVMFRL